MRTMNNADSKADQRPAEPPPSPATEPAICDRCGRPGAIEIAGVRRCLECYDLCASCCLEFGADDLWQERSDL